MTYVQYPHATLISLGTNLTALSDRLNGDQRGAEDVDGLSDQQQRIQNAIGEFRGAWKTSLLELMTNIGKWGGLSTTIGQMVHDFDAQLATALRPGSSPQA